MIVLDAVWRAEVQQQVYRRLLEAMSYPGRVLEVVDAASDCCADLHVLSVLCDQAVSLADAEGRLSQDDWSRLEAVPGGPATADIVLFDADQPPPEGFAPRLGDVYQPHLGATVVLCGEVIEPGRQRGLLNLGLQGPGIQTENVLSLGGFHGAWFEERKQWVAQYPMGVDMVLCDASKIVCLPRTTKIRVLGAGDVINQGGAA